MSSKRNGNVRQDQEEPLSKGVFEEGDVVALTQPGLRMTKLDGMCCRQLYQIGWPNEFIVRHVFETEEDGCCITLWPCCLHLVDRRNGQYRCKGHPAIYFTKVDFMRPPKKGDRRSSLILPIIGELLGFEYQDDEDNPQFAARVLGHGPVVTGFFAKLIKNLAEDNKVL